MPHGHGRIELSRFLAPPVGRRSPERAGERSGLPACHVRRGRPRRHPRPAPRDTARSSSTKWSSTKTCIGSATSEAPRAFSSGWPSKSADDRHALRRHSRTLAQAIVLRGVQICALIRLRSQSWPHSLRKQLRRVRPLRRASTHRSNGCRRPRQRSSRPALTSRAGPEEGSYGLRSRSRYQLGLLCHAGSLIVPLGASRPHGTCESAMNAACSAITSAANASWNFARSRNRSRPGAAESAAAGRVRSAEPAMRVFTDSPLSGTKAAM